MTLSRRAAIGILASVLSTSVAWADVPAAAPLSAADQSAVSGVVAYLQRLTNARGRFAQTSTRGGAASGTFTLQRPGRARFDYDPPSGVVIASDGRIVSVLDRRLKTIRTYPLSQTPLGLFLARDIRLDRGVVVREVIREGASLTVVAQDARKAQRGRIALNFAAAPLALTGWVLTDAGGGVVSVRLSGFQPSPARDAAYFQLTDPHRHADAETPYP